MTADCNQDAFICHQCLAVFLADVDFQEHKKATGHLTAARMKVEGGFRLKERNYLVFELP